MTITVDAENQGSAASSSSVTVSHTAGSGSSAVLYALVSVNNNNSQTITGVTYGGVAMTQVATFDGNKVKIYRLLAPTVGTANVVASFSAATDGFVFTGSYFGVDQVTPDSNATSAYNSSGVTVTSATGNIVIGIAEDAAGRTAWTATGAQTYSTYLSAGTATSAFGRAPGAASVAMTWSGPGTNLPRNLAINVNVDATPTSIYVPLLPQRNVRKTARFM